MKSKRCEGKKAIAAGLIAAMVLSILPTGMQIYAKKVMGNKDWKWPVPESNTISACYLDGRDHYGIDIAAPKGAKVYAAYEGEVVETYTKCPNNFPKKTMTCGCGGCSLLGNFIFVRHEYMGRNYISRYGHLTKVNVKVGDHVTMDTVIGTVGSTGRSSGYHLDLRIYEGTERTRETETCVDPLAQTFLELPEGFNADAATFACCKKYAKEIPQIYGDVLSNVGDKDEDTPAETKGKLTLTEENYPKKLTAGKKFSIKGIVKSGSKIERITVSIIDSDAEIAMKKSVKPDAKKFDLSTIKKDLAFEELEAGSYLYKVTVKANGKNTVLLKKEFSVVTGKKDMHEITFKLNGGKIKGRILTHDIDGYNRVRDTSELIVYTASGKEIDTNPYGIDIAVSANGKVTAVRRQNSKKRLTVPKDGMIVSGHCSGEEDSGGTFLKQVKKGYYVTADKKEKTLTVYSTYDKYLQKECVVPKGKKYGKLPTPERKGYRFLGWFDKKEEGKRITKNSRYRAEVLCACWEKAKKK